MAIKAIARDNAAAAALLGRVPLGNRPANSSTSPWVPLLTNGLNGTGLVPLVIYSDVNAPNSLNDNRSIAYVRGLLRTWGIISANNSLFPYLLGNAIAPRLQASSRASTGRNSRLTTWAGDLSNLTQNGTAGYGETLNEFFNTNSSDLANANPNSINFRAGGANGGIVLGYPNLRTNIWNGSEPMWGTNIDGNFSLVDNSTFFNEQTTGQQMISGVTGSTATPLTIIMRTDMGVPVTLPRFWSNYDDNRRNLHAVLRFFIVANSRAAVTANPNGNLLFAVELRLQGIRLYRSRAIITSLR